ncbi:MAG: dinitrogenase iron-molybdenum cofactor biosynthesis protein [Treponema sp.]|nr:dinitrogenase iron-molybdenum cofactor biosynthesis protein [Treponema sp.]
MADQYISKYRVALASTDGQTVNQHYGRAEEFYIYAVDDEEGYEQIEKRKVVPICHDGGHIKSEMADSTERFLDCRYVAASRMGAGASSALTAKGIIAMELPGSVDDAMLKIWKYNRIQGLFK